MNTREKCYCSGHEAMLCAVCEPARCVGCGRKVPMALLRKAYRERRGMVCTGCGRRKGHGSVVLDYLGI